MEYSASYIPYFWMNIWKKNDVRITHQLEKNSIFKIRHITFRQKKVSDVYFSDNLLTRTAANFDCSKTVSFFNIYHLADFLLNFFNWDPCITLFSNGIRTRLAVFSLHVHFYLFWDVTSSFLVSPFTCVINYIFISFTQLFPIIQNIRGK